jgi:hypothetical protein
MEIDASDPVYNGQNIWRAQFNNPTNGFSTTFKNLQVAEDSIVIFAAGRDTLGPSLAASSFGSAQTFDFNDPAFNEAVETRYQSGAGEVPPTDVGPWGGSIGFSINTNWGYAGPDEPPEPGKFDFFSVAMHEIAHVLGVGTADSWDTWVDGGQFTGPNAMAANLSSPGDPVGLSGGRDHWTEGTMSLVDGQSQEAAMDPTIHLGARKWLTDLDVAALTDIGWEIDSEPLLGDMDLSGTVDFDDVAPFVLGLNDPIGYAASFGQSPSVTGDTDLDGDFDFDDIPGFVDLLAGSSQLSLTASAPEPSSAALATVAILLVLCQRRRPQQPRRSA